MRERRARPALQDVTIKANFFLTFIIVTNQSLILWMEAPPAAVSVLSCPPPQVVPLHIKAASVFSGRIIKKEDDSFQNLVAEMTSHFADKKPGATDVLVGGLYAVQEDEDFHRSDALHSGPGLMQFAVVTGLFPAAG